MYVSIVLAKAYYNLTSDELCRLADSGEIDFVITKNNQRHYFIPDSLTENKFIYVRVASENQTDYLQHQIRYMTHNYPNHTVISDVGTGLNLNRAGLKSLLDKFLAGELAELVLASKDRLTRFVFELIEKHYKIFNTKIIVVNIDQELNLDDRLTKEQFSDDFFSIIGYFTESYNNKHRNINNTKNNIKFDDEVDISENLNLDLHSNSESKEIVIEPKRGRGRPAQKKAITTEQKRGRGRLTKQNIRSSLVESNNSTSESEDIVIEPKIVLELKRGRGRPTQNKVIVSEPTRGRGRPPKQNIQSSLVKSNKSIPKLEEPVIETQKRRGRPSKQNKSTSDSEEIITETKRGRGRPSKQKESTSDSEEIKIDTKRGRGRPSKQKVTESESEIESEIESKMEIESEEIKVYTKRGRGRPSNNMKNRKD